MNEVAIPTNLAGAALREGRHGWLDTLPATISDLCRRWKIRVGQPFQPGGATAWAAPVLTADGQRMVIKLVWPHPEAAHEADALRLWAGRGAVLLHAAEDLGHTLALLVERCHPGVALSSRPEPDQDLVLTRLLDQLWVNPPANHPFRPLVEMCNQWADQFETKSAARKLPVEPGLGSSRDGPVSPPTRHRRADRGVVHRSSCRQRAGRGARTVAGHRPQALPRRPHYDLLQHMRNCPSRLGCDPVKLIDRVARLAGLQPARTRLWLFARCVQDALDWADLVEVARTIAPP